MNLLKTIEALDAPYVVWLSQAEWYTFGQKYVPSFPNAYSECFCMAMEFGTIKIRPLRNSARPEFSTAEINNLLQGFP